MSIDRKLVDLRGNMIRRCYDPRHRTYVHSGARGIRVCAEWIDSPKSFYEWCQSNGWAQGLFLDRIDNDGDYSPLNCRFVTPSVSARNRRSNVWVTAWGETKLQVDWLKDTRCTVNAIRLKRELSMGTPPELAMTTHYPKGRTRGLVTAWGESKLITQWVSDDRCNSTRFQIAERLDRGIAPEEAIRGMANAQ